MAETPDFIRGLLTIIADLREELGGDKATTHYSDEEREEWTGMLEEVEDDLLDDPYAGAKKWAPQAMAHSDVVIQQIGTALYDLASRESSPSGLSRDEVLRIIEEDFGPPQARLFPFSYAIPYDTRRSIFELSSGTGNWLSYRGLTPDTSIPIAWAQVTGFDMQVRGADGRDYRRLLDNPVMREEGQVIGIRREIEDGPHYVVSFQTTGPVTLIGDGSPPFINATDDILSGTNVPTGSDGRNGDLWIKEDNGSLYVKVEGTWLPRAFELLKTAGARMRFVTGLPLASVGNINDAAINKTNGQWWEKTASATWTERRGLKAPNNILPTPTYVHIPVKRFANAAFDVGDSAEIAPGFEEYPILLLIPDLTERSANTPGQRGAAGEGYEEWYAITHKTPSELVAAELPNDHSGYHSPTLSPSRRYRVRARNALGLGAYSQEITLTE